MVVWNVTPALHTPLMSVTNAISSIIIIGAILQISSTSPLVVVDGGRDRRDHQRQHRGRLRGHATHARDVQEVGGDEHADSSPFPTSPRRFSSSSRSAASAIRETARRGNLFGIAGMVLALVAAIAGVVTANYASSDRRPGRSAAASAWSLAQRVQMTQMPELVAILHSLVGLAAVLVGFANFMDHAVALSGVEKTIHDVETYLGILIGAVTLSGSVIAFGKLNGSIGGKPLTLPGRHLLNLGLLVATLVVLKLFLDQSAAGAGLTPLLIMTGIALLFGVHMVMAIGGADMPVVVSMLNSYSGWAASATGFMLNNDLLIVTGALVGIERRDSELHHVPRDEPQVPVGHRRRVRRRRGRGAEGCRAGEAQGETFPIDADGDGGAARRREGSRHRSRLRHGRRPGPARRQRNHEVPARARASTCASPSIRSPAACPAT